MKNKLPSDKNPKMTYILSSLNFHIQILHSRSFRVIYDTGINPRPKNFCITLSVLGFATSHSENTAGQQYRTINS